jgi:hypothetical protein
MKELRRGKEERGQQIRDIREREVERQHTCRDSTW